MSSKNPRAAWQSEPCPAWCTQQHRDDDHPEDRFHDSVATRVPMVFAERDHEAGPGRWAHTPGEISIVTSRHAETSDVVVFIGRDEHPGQELSLTPEGAARLAVAIARHLDTWA